MPQPTAPPSTSALERKIRSAILRVVSERSLGRRRIEEITTGDVAAMAHAAWRTLPPEFRVRDTEAQGRTAAGKGPVRPLTAPNPVPADLETFEPPKGPQGVLQRLRSEPTPCAILALLADGCTDTAIAEKLGLTKNYVCGQVRRWKGATDSLRRADLATWARRNAAAVGPEAGR